MGDVEKKTLVAEAAKAAEERRKERKQERGDGGEKDDTEGYSRASEFLEDTA